MAKWVTCMQQNRFKKVLYSQFICHKFSDCKWDLYTVATSRAWKLFVVNCGFNIINNQ